LLFLILSDVEILQSNGQGIILAATWVAPLIVVPRAWDYPTTTTSSVETGKSESTGGK